MQTLQLIIKAVPANVLRGISAVNKALGTLVTTIFDAGVASLKAFGTIFVEVLLALPRVIGTVIGAITSIINTIANVVTAVVQLGRVFFSVLGSLVGLVTRVFGTIFGIISNTLADIVQLITTTVSDMIDRWLLFEQATDRIFGLVATKAGQSIAGIKKIGLELSDVLGKDLQGVMAGLFEVISGGFRDSKEAGQVLKAAGELAQTGWIELDDVITAVITTLNSYGLTANDAERATALLFETQVQGRGTIKQFATLLGNILPLAAGFGFSMEDAAAATALVTKVMGQSGRVMFSISSALAQLARPTKKMREAWTKYGFSIIKASDGTIDLKANLDSLRAIADRFGDEVIKELFGTRTAVRGIRSMIGLSKEMRDTVIDSIRSQKKSMADLAEAVKATRQTWSLNIDIMQQKISNLGVRVIDFLSVVFRPVFNEVMRIFDDTEEAVRRFATSGAFDELGAALSTLVEQFMRSQLFVVIIATIEAGIQVVIGLFGQWAQKVQQLAESGRALDFFNQVGIKIGNTIGHIIASSENWKAAWDAVKTQAVSLFNIFKPGLEEIDDFLLRMVTETIPNWIASWKDFDLPGLLASWIKAVRSFWGAVSRVTAGLRAGFAMLFPFLKDGFQRVKDAAMAFGNALLGIGKSIQALFNGVTATFRIVLGFLLDVTQVAVKAMRVVLTALDKIPEFFGAPAVDQGFVKGLKDAEKSLRGMSQKLLDGFKIDVGEARNAGNEAGQAFGKAFQQGGAVFEGRLGVIGEAAGGVMREFGRFGQGIQERNDPNSLINQFIRFLEERSRIEQQERAGEAGPGGRALGLMQQSNQLFNERIANQKAQEVELTNTIAQSTEQMTARNNELHGQAVASLQRISGTQNNHASQLVAMRQQIQGLENMLT